MNSRSGASRATSTVSLMGATSPTLKQLTTVTVRSTRAYVEIAVLTSEGEARHGRSLRRHRTQSAERSARATSPFPPCRPRSRQLPVPLSSCFHPPHPGKQYNGSMMSRANPAVFSLLREGLPTRRELVLDVSAHPSSSVEKRFALQPDSCACSSYSPPKTHRNINIPRYHVVPCELHHPHTGPCPRPPTDAPSARKSTNAIAKTSVQSHELHVGMRSRADGSDRKGHHSIS